MGYFLFMINILMWAIGFFTGVLYIWKSQRKMSPADFERYKELSAFGKLSFERSDSPYASVDHSRYDKDGRRKDEG